MDQRHEKAKAQSTKHKDLRPKTKDPRPKILFIEWSWSSIHASHAHLIDDPDVEIVFDEDLAREPNVFRQLGFHREPVALEFPHLARIAVEHLDATGGAAGVAATAMQNVYAGIFDCQDELFAFGCFKWLSSACGFRCNRGHSVGNSDMKFIVETVMNLA